MSQTLTTLLNMDLKSMIKEENRDDITLLQYKTYRETKFVIKQQKYSPYNAQNIPNIYNKNDTMRFQCNNKLMVICLTQM